MNDISNTTVFWSVAAFFVFVSVAVWFIISHEVNRPHRANTIDRFKVFKSAHGEYFFVQKNYGSDDWWTVQTDLESSDAAWQWIKDEIRGSTEVTRPEDF